MLYHLRPWRKERQLENEGLRFALVLLRQLAGRGKLQDEGLALLESLRPLSRGERLVPDESGIFLAGLELLLWSQSDAWISELSCYRARGIFGSSS